MNKRYVMLFLVLSMIMVSLSCVNAEGPTVNSDMNVADTVENTANTQYSSDDVNTENVNEYASTSVNEFGLKTNAVDTSDDLNGLSKMSHELNKQSSTGLNKKLSTENNESHTLKLILYKKDSVYVNSTIEASGYLIDDNYNEIPDKEVLLTITNPEGKVTSFNLITDSEGQFGVNYTLTETGEYLLHASCVYGRNNETVENDGNVIVLRRPINNTLTLNPLAEKYYQGEEIVISGVLIDVDNNPLSNQEITIIIDKFDHFAFAGDYFYTSVLTDENGFYNYTFIPDILGDIRIFLDFYGGMSYTHSSIITTTHIVDPNFKEAVLTLDPIFSRLFLWDKLIISGTLTDTDNNPLSDKTIKIGISGGESDYGIYSYVFNVTTDENGRYTYQHNLDNEGAMHISVSYGNDGTYGYTDACTISDVGFLEVIISMDPTETTINLGDNLIISGNITDLNNITLANQELYARFTYENGEEDVIENITTDNNGRYELSYTPYSSGNLTIKVLSHRNFIDTYPVRLIDVLDNSSVNENVTSEENDTASNSTDNSTIENSTTNNVTSEENDTVGNPTDNTTVDNSTVDNNVVDGNVTENDTVPNNESQENKGQNDNKSETGSYTNNHNNIKTHQKIRTYEIIKPAKTLGNDKKSEVVLKHDTKVTLSWLNNIFKHDFKNRTLLIYIDDVLVFNGTVSDDPSEVLFEVLEKYQGEHFLKVVEDNNTYQEEVTII